MLFDWQTMLAAIVAGVPAAIGAFLLWKQIRLQRAETDRIREKEEISARIRLISALSALTTYYKESIGPLLDGMHRSSDIPNASLETLMASAPAVNEEVFKHVQKVIMDFQIFSALYPPKSGAIGPNAQDQALVVLAQLHKATNELYPFARFKTETVTSTLETKEQLSDSLNSLLALSGSRPNLLADATRIKRAMLSKFKPQTSKTVPPVEV